MTQKSIKSFFNMENPDVSDSDEESVGIVEKNYWILPKLGFK